MVSLIKVSLTWTLWYGEQKAVSRNWYSSARTDTTNAELHIHKRNYSDKVKGYIYLISMLKLIFIFHNCFEMCQSQNSHEASQTTAWPTHMATMDYNSQLHVMFMFTRRLTMHTCSSFHNISPVQLKRISDTPQSNSRDILPGFVYSALSSWYQYYLVTYYLWF